MSGGGWVRVYEWVVGGVYEFCVVDECVQCI